MLSFYKNVHIFVQQYELTVYRMLSYLTISENSSLSMADAIIKFLKKLTT